MTTTTETTRPDEDQEEDDRDLAAILENIQNWATLRQGTG